MYPFTFILGGTSKFLGVDCIAEVIGQYKTVDNENMFDIKFSIDDQLFWETLKIMLRGKTISYSTIKKKKERKY
jgi:hypothetical protein